MQSTGAAKSRRKFLRNFPAGSGTRTIWLGSRTTKSMPHRSWTAQLNPDEFAELLRADEYQEVALRAVKIESRTNLIFSFEKMALRDAVRSKAGPVSSP